MHHDINQHKSINDLSDESYLLLVLQEAQEVGIGVLPKGALELELLERSQVSRVIFAER